MTNLDVIEPADDGDGDAIADLIAAVFSEYPNCPFDRAAEFPELDAVATYFRDLGGRIWVARRNGSVIGCFGIHPTSDHEVWEIKKVYVDRSTRGRGVAGKLHLAAVNYAEGAGARAIRLWTDTRFADGHRFYEAKGYRRMPGTRYLADLARTWEFAYRRDLS